MPATSALLRPETVAERLGVSRRHVYKLVADGELEAVVVGRLDSTHAALRVHPDALARFLATHRKRPPLKLATRPLKTTTRRRDYSRFPGADTFTK